MNEVERLAKNIKVFIETGCLEEEMRTIAEENPHLDDLGELNDIMETEIGYFGNQNLVEANNESELEKEYIHNFTDCNDSTKKVCREEKNLCVFCLALLVG